MKKLSGTDIIGSQLAEWVPGYEEDFPHMSYLCQLERQPAEEFCDCPQVGGSSWHWFGKSVGFLYVTEGAFEFVTSAGKQVITTGSGGLLNINVLHSIRLPEGVDEAKMYCHLFDPKLISGDSTSRISQKYVQPVIGDKKLEVFVLDREDEKNVPLLEQLKASFSLDEEAPEYEIKIRNVLSEIWIGMFAIIEPHLGQQKKENKSDEKVKRMMVYVYQHYDEKLAVADIAAAAFVSVRECFRIFSSNLGTTPEKFVRDYRLRMACQMLSSTTDSVTTIGYNCGFRNNSYFCKIFRENIGISPLAYRKRSRNQ